MTKVDLFDQDGIFIPASFCIALIIFIFSCYCGNLTLIIASGLWMIFCSLENGLIAIANSINRLNYSFNKK